MKLDMLSYLGTDYAKDKQLIKKILSNPTILVGWVDSFNAENGTVNVQPAIQDKIIDENSVLNYVNKPYLVNCWVISNTLNRQPQKGDKALILVLDEKSNNFFKSQYDSTKTLSTQTFVNTSKNIKSLANSVAIIVNSNYAEGIGTVVNVNGVAQDEINFTSDPQTQITENTNNISQLSNPNLLINGDFRVNQRGETSYSNFANKYCVDRWRTAGNSVTVTPMDYGCSVSVGGTGRYYSVLDQIIEDYASLIGKPVTLSANIKSVSVNLQSYQYCIKIRCYDTNNELITISESWITTAGNYSCTLTIPSNTVKISCGLYKNAVVDCTFEIEYIKLEIGSVATPYSPRPYAEELAMCKRYYISIKNTSGTTWMGNYLASGSGNLYITIPLPTELRIAPTITIISSVILFDSTFTTVSLSNLNNIRKSPMGCSFLATPSITKPSGNLGTIRNVDDSSTIIELDAEIY